MALVLGSDLETDKVLIWKTEIPFENTVRQSSYFSLMGLKWCLQFSYNGKSHSSQQTYDNIQNKYILPNTNVYHVITLHRVINGQIAISNDASVEQILENKIGIQTSLLQPEKDRTNEICKKYSSVAKNGETIWYGGDGKDQIFKNIPYLYGCCEIKVVCMFYGQPLSSFQLEIGKGGSATVSTEGLDDLQSLSQDLGKLLQSGQGQDVRLNCEDRTFPAHRSVLAARSEVFAAMFRSQMAESETGSVDVKDFPSDVVQHFLQYLYRGKLTAESREDVTSLLAIADKYAVDSLKVACTRRMLGGMTEENCVEYLSVADLHATEPLKREAATFICGHPAVMLSDQWAELAKRRPELALEVLHSFVRSKTEA